MSTNIYVVPQRKEESQDRMINRFFKKYRESNLYNEIRDGEFYVSDSEKAHAQKRKYQHLNDIYKKIKDGKLRPRNKELYKKIMEK